MTNMKGSWWQRKKVKIREGTCRNWTSYVRTVKSAVSYDKAESFSRRTVLTSSSTHITAAVKNIWKTCNLTNVSKSVWTLLIQRGVWLGYKPDRLKTIIVYMWYCCLPKNALRINSNYSIKPSLWYTPGKGWNGQHILQSSSDITGRVSQQMGFSILLNKH